MDNERQYARFALQRVKVQKEELEARQFPGNHDGPKKILGLSQAVIVTAEDLLDSSLSEDHTVEKKAELIQDALNLTLNTYNLLSVVEAADTSHLPYSVVLPLQRWLNDLKVPNDTLFRAEAVANYEISPLSEKFIIRGIRDPSQKIKDEIGRAHV